MDYFKKWAMRGRTRQPRSRGDQRRVLEKDSVLPQQTKQISSPSIVIPAIQVCSDLPYIIGFMTILPAYLLYSLHPPTRTIEIGPEIFQWP